MSSIPSTLPSFLRYFAKRYWPGLVGFIFVGIFWAVNLSLKPYAMKLLIDSVSNSESSNALFSVAIVPAVFYVGLGFTAGLVWRFYDWVQIKTFPEMKIKIIEEMFDYVEKHSYSYFQHNFAGSLGNKINDMARSAVSIIGIIIDRFIVTALSLLIGSITMFLVHPYFACVLIVWSTIFVSVSVFLSLKAQKYWEILSNARSTVVGKIVDSIGNILNVKLFARAGYENSYLRKYLEDIASKDRNSKWYLLKVKAFYTFSIACLSAAMMGLLLYERSKNSITVGDFALILTLNMFLVDEVFHLAEHLVLFSEEVGTCNQALSIISPTHEIVDIPDAKELQVSKGEIVFENVHFQYKKGKRVFANKSITINAGERVGLVGFSGSGKSTFVHLILRFYDIDSGTILIDGQDISTITQESLRSQIAMIPQDPVLFHRSLSENIGYGCLNASEEAIIEASKKAHCHEFAEKMQDGYRTLVGERGAKLSGGQRQRIAIARAILKNAPILILDEATSALDSITEKYIQDSLHHLMKGRTTLVIAHRLSTLFHMDRILVFNEGRVIEQGTHDQLIRLEGDYAKLWNVQAGGFIDDSQRDPEESFEKHTHRLTPL